MRYDVEQAQDIATETQAYDAQGVAAQAVAVSLRSQSGTAAALTTGTRANKATTTGSLTNDLFFETDTTWLYRWTGAAWAWMEGVYMATEATRTALTISAADNGAIFFATDTLILWQVAAGVWTKRLEIKGTANQISASIAAGVLTLALVASPDVATSYKVAGSQVLGARKTGWGTATGAATRTTFDTAAVTLPELAERVKALIDDLHQTAGHGAIGT